MLIGRTALISCLLHDQVIRWTGDVRLPLMFDEDDIDMMCTVLEQAMHFAVNSGVKKKSNGE